MVTPFTPRHLAEACDLVLAAQAEWAGSEDRQSLEGRLSAPRLEGWVIEEEGDLLAVAAWGSERESHCPSDLGYRSAHLAALYVKSDRQGEGLGLALHEQILQRARLMGMDSMRLWTPEIAKSRGFYERLNYRDSGRRIEFSGLTRVEYRKTI